MSIKLFKKIFSIKITDDNIIFNLLWFNFSFRNIFAMYDQMQSQCGLYKDWLISLNGLNLENFLNSKLQNTEQTYQEFINDLFSKNKIAFVTPGENWRIMLKFLPILFKKSEIDFKTKGFSEIFDIIAFWGSNNNDGNVSGMYNSIIYDKPIAIVENSFLTTIKYTPNIIDNKGKNYNSFVSFIFDNKGVYYDARRTNYLEEMLNDKELVLTDEQKQRARNCINKIVSSHLSKYNNQPIYKPMIGREGAKKVLVVDQSYGDAAIQKGLASEATFDQMLADAIKENPDADIIVKTHPDTKAGAKGYLTNTKQQDNVYPMVDLINPISLLKYVDKVYVCTSQFGFEALMCNKEVKVYGLPFYAGWGLTNDVQKCARRRNSRTLEEVFYITYIMYTHWVNPATETKCEIEDAIEYLLKLRDEYFKEGDIYGICNK